MQINEHDFADIDLNLIVTFLVLFRERSVSRAADHLSVRQPAMSGSLVRLRHYFNDPLFIREQRGLRPTSKAIQMAEALLPSLSHIGSVIAKNGASV